MRKAVWIAAVLLGTALELHAQTNYRIMVGPALNSVNPFDSQVGKDLGPGLIVRGVPRRGWGMVIDLSFFTLDLKRSRESSPLGELGLRTFLAGLGYTIERGRLATTFAVATGHGFARTETLLTDLSRQGSRFEASSRPLVRTTVTLNWSAGRRVVLTSSIGTLLADPNVRLRFGDASRPPETGTWGAHSLLWQVGAAYKLF
jgi:hypothetical protein